MCHLPTLARDPVNDACTASIFGTSLCQHARIGFTTVLYTTPQLRSTNYILHTQYVPHLADLLGEVAPP